MNLLQPMKKRTSGNQSTPRRKPQRTCIACRNVREKRELVRLVRTPEGVVTLDETGRMPGRGAYLCTDPVCWEKAVKGNLLEHAFRITIKQENRTALLQRGKLLLEEKTIGQSE